MNDYIVRATAADHSIRAFAITSKNIVEEARKDHNTSPVITAALGRLLSGAAMMGTMMKGEKDLLTVQIQCQGPAQGLTVTADSAGHVKGFPRVADVALPPNALGKLDVGGALGIGVMSVIKDMGLKEPYVGQIALPYKHFLGKCVNIHDCHSVKRIAGFNFELYHLCLSVCKRVNFKCGWQKKYS